MIEIVSCLDGSYKGKKGDIFKIYEINRGQRNYEPKELRVYPPSLHNKADNG